MNWGEQGERRAVVNRHVEQLLGVKPLLNGQPLTWGKVH